MRPRAVGVLIAIAVFAADQATKAAILSRLGGIASEPAPLAPFLDLAVR